jgi:hypothetical protein
MTVDHRIRFSPTPIDFANDVGITGQDHDTYPAPGQQARYDWMRMFLIGLLSCQSSDNPPNQYREGTPWFDLTDVTLKIRRNGAWVSVSQVIKLADTTTPNDPLTLQDWFNAVNEDIESLRSEIFFYGTIQSFNATLIPIPTNLLDELTPTSRPFVYIDGVLINPASTSLEPGPNPTAVGVPSGGLTQGSEFMVVIKSIPNDNFNTLPVTV